MAERARRTTARLQIETGFLIALLVGIFGATLALGQAAASIGIGLEPFRPLGGSFFSFKAGQARYLEGIQNQEDAANNHEILPFARNILQNAPLSSRAAWLLGVGFEARRDTQRASSIMAQADKISRRESLPQIWLAQQALRRGNASLGMRYFDVVLRTEPSIKPRILPQLSGLLEVAGGSELLQSYARPENAWYPDFLVAAATTQPDVRPVAKFMMRRGAYLPDDPASVEAYQHVVRKLAEMGEYQYLLALYPRLPGARPESLQSLDFGGFGARAAYPPVDWDLQQSAGRSATPTSVADNKIAVEFIAAPGIVAPLARKLVMPRGEAAISFRITEKTANDGSTAHWRATCLSSGRSSLVTQSADLFSAQLDRGIEFALPRTCPLVMIEFVMAGGIGRDEARLLVESIDLRSLPAPNR